MISHRYTSRTVPVDGGDLHLGVWEPEEAAGEVVTVLAVHGVTSSHLAWPFYVEQLPGVRVIAPDLRGRGRSNTLVGAAGMAAHARDLVAVLDAFDLDAVPVIGHSMGGFVAVVLAHLAPERVSQLLLIDGGMPLNVPVGLAPEALVAAILGPTAERLRTRWGSTEQYIAGFWRNHPSFAEDWSDELEAYIAYDLTPDGDALRPATSYQTTVDDTIDLNTGTALPEALEALGHETLFVTVPRGLQNEPPGLYSEGDVATWQERYPGMRTVRLEDLNHYTVVMSARGARAVAPLLREALALPA